MLEDGSLLECLQSEFYVDKILFACDSSDSKTRESFNTFSSNKWVLIMAFKSRALPQASGIASGGVSTSLCWVILQICDSTYVPFRVKSFLVV